MTLIQVCMHLIESHPIHLSTYALFTYLSYNVQVKYKIKAKLLLARELFARELENKNKVKLRFFSSKV